jgi:calcineurin-like phosphoesterase family protein
MIADTHYGHANIIKYCQRPFASVEEMNETIIQNWNKVVKKNDIVWHLGDFALMKDDNIAVGNLIRRLNGKINLIFGSHDKQAIACKHLFNKCYYKNTIVDENINGYRILMGHCPMLSWEGKAHDSLHAFGHVHSGEYKKFLCAQNSADVGVDAWGYSPVHFDDFVKRAKSTEGKLRLNVFDEWSS